jgi:hypothetical protein
MGHGSRLGSTSPDSNAKLQRLFVYHIFMDNGLNSYSTGRSVMSVKVWNIAVPDMLNLSRSQIVPECIIGEEGSE